MPLALQGAALALAATPVAGLRELLHAMREAAPLVWLCKGFEEGTGLLPHQIAAQTLGGEGALRRAVGPVVRRRGGARTALRADARFAATPRLRARAAALLHGGRMRVYYSTDLVGVEIGGAVKNVMAIAAGISDGLGLGLNARAALITRGLAEIARLGVALGGAAETLFGLAGAGDLILTATGDLSRNRRVGLELARGTSAERHPRRPRPRRRGRALGEGGRAARQGEAASTCRSRDAVNAVLDGKLTPAKAVELLLSRDPRKSASVRP